jgi:hypothetical protein
MNYKLLTQGTYPERHCVHLINQHDLWERHLNR